MVPFGHKRYRRAQAGARPGPGGTGAVYSQTPPRPTGRDAKESDLPADVILSRAGAGRNAGLRCAVPLAALTGRKLRLQDLSDDGKKPRPGLGPGGLTCLAAASVVTGGYFAGGVGDEHAVFQPGRIQAGDWAFDVAEQERSAAPFSLVLETLAPILAAAPGTSSLVLRGGSHIIGGPSSDELAQVLAPCWRALGVAVDYTEVTPGFFPAGGGEAEARITPGRPQPLEALERFKPAEVGVTVLSSGLPAHLAEQALEAATDRLGMYGIKAEGRIRRARGGAGMALLAWARGEKLHVGFASVGRRGGRPGELATAAVDQLAGFLASGAGAPGRLAASLLPLLVAAPGVSRLTVDRVGPGLGTACRAADAFFPGCIRLDEPGEDRPSELRVMGLGLI